MVWYKETPDGLERAHAFINKHFQTYDFLVRMDDLDILADGMMQSGESNVHEYFPYCPLCGSKRMEANITMGGRDTISCENCRARWHIYIGFSGFKWAELDIKAKNGKGAELLGKRLNGDEWLRIAKKARAQWRNSLSEKKIERVVVADLRKGDVALEKMKPMVDGKVTERRIGDKKMTLTLDTGYTIFLYFEEG